jgi:glutamate--cysteine ligase
MPKSRYKVMRDYLPQRGALAEYMMKATCSVQCNYDYRDEADCARKVRLCSGLAPLTTAMFSNSPLYKNRPTGFKSFRGHIWSQTDPDRCGFPAAIRSRWSIEAWVDYLLEVPMMFFYRDELFYPAHGRTFQQFMTEGIDGHFATLSDWDLHQTSVFPEVRVKRTIEVRGADCVKTDLALAFCALFTGLLYCDIALDEGLELVAEIEGHGSHPARLAVASEGGLAGAFGGRRISDWASDLGEIAERGLKNCLPDDLNKLDPLLERIEAGRSPADDLLAAWSRDDSPESVLRAVAY